MADKDEQNFDFAMAILADSQAYIADHKKRRWEMVKWGVSVNLAFATATAVKSQRDDYLSFFLFVMGMAISLASVYIIVHLNRRMTRTRLQGKRVSIWLEDKGVDVEGITGEKPRDAYPLGEKHDYAEMWTATIVLLLIPFLSLVRVVITG